MAITRKVDWAAITTKMSEGTGKKAFRKDDEIAGLYVPKIKDDGTFEALIRFLPSPDTDLPFAILYNHGFEGDGGKWFIENCPKSIGEDCPVCAHASKIWKSGDEERARKRFKKWSVFSNILVVKDPQTPENEGKVFYFRYGKKMYETIKNKMLPPQGSIDEPLFVFDYVDGANFKLKIKSKVIKLGGQNKAVANYDSSEFVAPSKLGTDAFINEIDSQLKPLAVFLAKDRFKDSATLLDKLNTIENGAPAAPAQSTPSVAYNKPSAAPAATPAPTASDDDGATDDEFFASLGN